MNSYNPNYELPKAVVSARDYLQGTCRDGAVVSGVLASIGAQLLGTFQNVDGDGGAKEFFIMTCYASIFLNIGAAVSSLAALDHLGEIGFQAAAIRDPEDDRQLGKIRTTPEGLLMKFGASLQLRAMLYHCLLTNYLGILTLIIAVLTYVVMVASKPTKIVISLIVAFTLLPTTYFILFRPLSEPSRRIPTPAPWSVEVEMEERDSITSSSLAPRIPEHLSSDIPAFPQPLAVRPMLPL